MSEQEDVQYLRRIANDATAGFSALKQDQRMTVRSAIRSVLARLSELEELGSVCATARESLAEMDKIAGDLRAQVSELNGLLCAANLRIAELERAQTWRPIEEAPRGVPALIARDDGGLSIETPNRHWQPYTGPRTICGEPISQPSHFMPLPEPPKS